MPLDTVRAAAVRTADLVKSFVRDTLEADKIRGVLVATPLSYVDAKESNITGYRLLAPDEVVRGVLLLAHHDSAGALRQLALLKSLDTHRMPGSGTPAAYRVAVLSLALGDRKTAVARLDEIIHTVQSLDPNFMKEVTYVATLVRAFALRAEIAQREGDFKTAREYAHTVLTLWKDADSELEPVLKEMKAIYSTRG
jgi:hypothetical protein